MFVYPRVSSGVLAEYVKPDDVCLMLRNDAGTLIDAVVTVESVDDCGLQLAYVVATHCVNTISLSVSVYGVDIGPAMTVHSGYDAINGTNHVASYDVGTDAKYGKAVNANGNMLVVSYADLHQVHVFQLTPSFERVCVIGREGTGPGELQSPAQLCFTYDDTILVCDGGNNRVQQLTIAGEHLSSFDVRLPYSIAVHGDMVAVGTRDCPIEIHSLATGELIRCFELDVEGPGAMFEFATDIRYTLDGVYLLVAVFLRRQLSLFTVEGAFVKRTQICVSSDACDGVTIGSAGEIIVADSQFGRISVLSADGDSLIKTWGSQGSAAGQFQSPTSLAVSGSNLYVMDNNRVQVFQ